MRTGLRSAFVLVAFSACAAPLPTPASTHERAAAAREEHPTAYRPRLPNDGEVVSIDGELFVRRVAPDAFEVTDEPFHSGNILAVKMPDGTVVLCSSPMDTKGTRALLAWVHAALVPTRVVAINTHFHMDGTGGNEAYRDLGVITYGSDHTRALLAKRGEAHRADAASGLDDEAERARVLATKITYAENTFPEREGLVLHLGGEEVRVLYPGPAHAPDNLLVYFPARELLFGGCMIKTSHSIGFMGDADLGHWEEAIEFARRLGAKTVIPGHGEGTGTDLFDVTIAAVREAQARGGK